HLTQSATRFPYTTLFRSPNAREAVRLQFHAHRELVGLSLGGALARLLHLVGDAEQVLDVVSDLVRDNVGLGEVPRRAEALVELRSEEHTSELQSRENLVC